MSDIESISEDSDHEAGENLEALMADINIGEEPSGNENQMDYPSNETENKLDDGLDPNGLDPNESPEDSMKDKTIKEALDYLVQQFKEKKRLPEVTAELIYRKKLNSMILDLYDYDKGYEISFQNIKEEIEHPHGIYPYGVSLIDYIRDGEIPYEIFDKIYNYEFQLFYDGYVACQLRINFAQEESMRTHFVLLRHTIQTIDAECAMKCKEDSSLDFETERARLICQYSPDLCLDPSPVVAEVVIANELGRRPFITPALKHIIQNERARREMGVVKALERDPSNFSKPASPKPEDNWSFRLDDPTEMEIELSELASETGRNPSILSFIRERRIYFPDKESFTGSHVEIENFVYEYDGCTRDGKVESIQDILCIGVLDDKEYYYGAYKLDKRMRDYVAFYWWDIGDRESLDLHVNAVTKIELKMKKSQMKITHNRMFDEKVEVSNGDVKIIRYKLENPASQVILQYPAPLSKDEDEEADDDEEETDDDEETDEDEETDDDDDDEEEEED